MNKLGNNKRISKAVSILAIGAILTAGGMFLWRNQFDFSLFSSASSKTIQTVMNLGEKSTQEKPQHAIQVVNLLTASQRKPPELIDRSESSTIISSLRDQAVLSYNDASKPITDHVYILIRTGKNAAIKGITEKDPVTTVSTKVSKEITTLIDLLTARPGVFPEGYTIFVATLPDPTDGTGDVSRCSGLIPNNGADYIKGVFNSVNAAIENTAAIYPTSIRIVDIESLFKGHGVNTSDSWFRDCATINEKGETEVAKEFAKVIEEFE